MPITAAVLAPSSFLPASPDEGLAWIARAIHQGAAYLPAQGPITAFIHHNTLHAFEDLDFDAGVVAGGELFGCHPYLREEDFRARLAAGRISREDIEGVLIEDLGDRGDQLLGFLGTRFALRRNMLAHPLQTGTAAELRWAIAETEALQQFREETPPENREVMVASTRQWVMRDLYVKQEGSRGEARAREYVERIVERFGRRRLDTWDKAQWEALTLHLLWMICRDGVGHADPAQAIGSPPTRHRDLVVEATGQDSDRLVDELLIPFCATFLDQGFAHWGLPRDGGFFATFAALYAQPIGPPDRWRRGLARELERIKSSGLTPLEVIDESCTLLGLARDEIEPYLLQTLLALRGYAGMIWQLETRGDRAASPVPAGTLVEYVAVRLLLERLALAHVAADSLNYRGPLDGLRGMLGRATGPAPPTREQRAFLVFQLAQLEGWEPEMMYRLSPREWRWVVREIEAFSRLERRRIYHLAFERRYRMQVLDALAAHQQARSHQSEGTSARPSFQIVCCLDEREESFRRHLEEVAPTCETLGAAGFFSVAMYYRGAADAHFTPLCPVVVRPQHYVEEQVVTSMAATERRRRRRRRVIGTVTRRAELGSRTFAGGWIAGVLGSIASLPLVMRVFFPRATSRVGWWLAKIVQTPSLSRLRLKRLEVTASADEPQVGFLPDEMAEIVERLLRDVGLTTRLSRLLLLCGHGSSSLNNPHESAYDCGACGGSPGGPNARAFAQMANDPQVRDLVARRGITIPDDTRFVGCYHNTCDDSVTFYDLELLPPTHWDEMERVRQQIDEARARNAHERCRRFESASITWSPDRALQHVEGRAEDLSQPRPELGHATNAVCLVGRREWSRGLFMDRRAFLQSYEPDQDDDQHSVLTGILQAVIPVCVGINLEYYFSYVDPEGYGCGSKLPHNIVSLLGVMNGPASDLRTGLPWQMVEIHEPMRLLMIIETTPQALHEIMSKNPPIDRLVHGEWLHLATFDPETNQIQLFRKGTFERHPTRSSQLPQVASSIDWYRGWRGHLGFATIEPAPSARRAQ